MGGNQDGCRLDGDTDQHEDLDEEVQKLRQSLTFETDEPFDAALSYAIYQQTFGPIAEKLAGKARLSVFANGALTSLPFAVLITSDPQGKKLKDDDWLIRSYAVTILPSIYSLKTMRAQAGGLNGSEADDCLCRPCVLKGGTCGGKGTARRHAKPVELLSGLRA